jgi:quinol-cytochrome oxidoreductase complex cytochrome b subunit
MLLALAILAIPFLDRSVERRPWKRPVAIGAYTFVVIALVGLGASAASIWIGTTLG